MPKPPDRETAGVDAARYLLQDPERRARVRHAHTVPRRSGRRGDWPGWADPAVVEAFARAGIDRPWAHQVSAAEAAWSGEHLVLATGTASGKSLAYLLPVLTALRDGGGSAGGPGNGGAAAGRGVVSRLRGATALYVSPTKALAADQLATVRSLGVEGVDAALCDGDTSSPERRRLRRYAGLVLTNPDLLHHSLLPGHARWASFLRSLRYVVIDECHQYRGIFGSQVAMVLRRLRRLLARYGAEPTFVLFSATAGDPGPAAERLLGLPVRVFDEDDSPRGDLQFLLWEPPMVPLGPTTGPRIRRDAAQESADLLACLVARGIRTLAFLPSRTGAEQVASRARHLLASWAPEHEERVAAYRGGYLPEERREIEDSLRGGRLLGLASTSALELGIDVAGLDAVVICGWPGRHSSLWQRAGRAGRRGRSATAVLVTRDDPLDRYLARHPEVVFDGMIETTVLDPDNPYVLAPHLCAAAAEMPIVREDLGLFGPAAQEVLQYLVENGALRRRPRGWYWPRTERATDLTNLRGTEGEPFRIVEGRTGQFVGTVDAGAANRTVHPGAVYVHRGRPWEVLELDLPERLAVVRECSGDVLTGARQDTTVRVLSATRVLSGAGCRPGGTAGQDRSSGPRRLACGGPDGDAPYGVGMFLGTVEVVVRTVSFVRRDAFSGAVLGHEPLDLPSRVLRTTAVWWSVSEDVLVSEGTLPHEVPGSMHALEHALLGMLPLVATCDRQDVAGAWHPCHPDTGSPTVFVHDSAAGGAGFAERGYRSAERWLRATRSVLADCECTDGCPSCVHSANCSSGNEPLDRSTALRTLDTILQDLFPAGPCPAPDTDRR